MSFNKINKNLLNTVAITGAIAFTSSLIATAICIGIGYVISETTYICSEKLDALEEK